MTNKTITWLAGVALAATLAAGPVLAQQVAADYSGPTEPAKAPPKLKVTAITCLSILHGCVSPAEGIQHAGKELGWDVTVSDGGGAIPASRTPRSSTRSRLAQR
jgi:ribose transport system substrate-binding protein